MMPDTSSKPFAAKALEPFQEFFHAEAAGGIVLLACTAIALIWANSPLSASYEALFHHEVAIGGKLFALSLSVHEWVNDGLMAIFFLQVGLEIKRELLVGELSSVRQAALPIAGAIGGMIVPAALFALVNIGSSGARGWGIPMATDIAFALGIVALLGPRVPPALKVFLAALAIVDDVGAVLVIALFYTSSVSVGALEFAGVVLALLLVLNRAGVENLIPYSILGVLLWIAILMSGIHATVAGVILAMTIPATSRRKQLDAARAPLRRMEHALHGAVAFLIVPLFAIANAGVEIGPSIARGLSAPIVLGVVLGLAVGKPLGITLASWLAVRARAASLPAEVSWKQLHGVSWLGGIGFTMSLFIAALAFENIAQLDSAKIGVIAASCVAGATGWLLLQSRGAA